MGIANGQSNGTNGTNGHSRAEVVRAHAVGGLVEISDLATVAVLAVTLVKESGRLSVREMEERLQTIGATVNYHNLEQACERLRDREWFAYASGRKPTGDPEKKYKLRHEWRAPLALNMPITQLLPSLLATPAAKKLLKDLGATWQDESVAIDPPAASPSAAEREDKPKRTVTSDEGTVTESQRIKYADYVRVRLDCVTLDELLGGLPENSYLLSQVQKSPQPITVGDGDETPAPRARKAKRVRASNNENAAADGEPSGDASKPSGVLRFARDGFTGDLVITRDVVGGWTRNGFRQLNVSPEVLNYIGVTPIILPLRSVGRIGRLTLPINQNGKGKGLAEHEVLAPGVRFSVTYDIPEKGFMKALKFVKLMTYYAPNPQRGLSPGRSHRYGRVAVVGYEVLGRTEDLVDSGLDHLANTKWLPAEAAAFARKLKDQTKL
jgi:hypothetical protein